VRKFDVDALRRNMGIVFQDSFLFSNTVAANIAFGHPDASMVQVERAARLAAAADFVNEMPEKYESMVGEHGANLSGGQRQRLALARAVLLDPPILLLDDATASIDPETEHEIQLALAAAAHGRTTIIASNRVSSLRDAGNARGLGAPAGLLPATGRAAVCGSVGRHGLGGRGIAAGNGRVGWALPTS
jgi:ATP-binding cassette subfamily B protein